MRAGQGGDSSTLLSIDDGFCAGNARYDRIPSGYRRCGIHDGSRCRDASSKDLRVAREEDAFQRWILPTYDRARTRIKSRLVRSEDELAEERESCCRHFLRNQMGRAVKQDERPVTFLVNDPCEVARIVRPGGRRLLHEALGAAKRCVLDCRCDGG